MHTMFLVLLKYIRPLHEVDQHLQAHRNFLDRYYQNNQLVCSGPMNPREGGVILAKAKDRDELDKIFKEDPFQVNQIAEYQIIEFNPVKASSEFMKCF